MSKVPTAKSGRSPLTLEENERRFILYQQGLSDSQIAKTCGISKTSIRNWRIRRGLARNSETSSVEEERLEEVKPKERTNKYQPLTPEEEEHRILLYQKGLSDSEIARICGVASGSIQRWRVRRGLKLNDGNPCVKSLMDTSKNEELKERFDESKKRQGTRVMYHVSIDGRVENHLFPWMDTYTELED